MRICFGNVIFIFFKFLVLFNHFCFFFVFWRRLLLKTKFNMFMSIVIFLPMREVLVLWLLLMLFKMILVSMVVSLKKVLLLLLLQVCLLWFWKLPVLILWVKRTP
jgi:hypothetical protein